MFGPTSPRYQSCDPRAAGQQANKINQAPVHTSVQTRSFYAMGPAMLSPQNGNPGSVWDPIGGFWQPVDDQKGHDALGGRIMQVPQADMLDSSRNMPGSGIFDQPGAAAGTLKLIRLAMTGSARAVPSFASGPTPTIFFQAPPSFSQQTTPIVAVGL